MNLIVQHLDYQQTMIYVDWRKSISLRDYGIQLEDLIFEALTGCAKSCFFMDDRTFSCQVDYGILEDNYDRISSVSKPEELLAFDYAGAVEDYIDTSFAIYRAIFPECHHILSQHPQYSNRELCVSEYHCHIRQTSIDLIYRIEY